MQKLRRLYRVTDAEMLQEAKVMRNCFVQDQADFVAYDSNLAAPFQDHWQQAIDRATAHPDDETIRDQLQQHTAKVKAAMQACHNKYMDTKYFIRRAFPNNYEVWASYGFNTFLETARQQLLLIEFMKVFYKRAVEHTAQLNAVGMDNASIAQIETLYLQLQQANDQQEAFKAGRKTLTANRKKDLNALWNIMQDINRVARSIYRNNYTQRLKYKLPVRSPKKKEEEEN